MKKYRLPRKTKKELKKIKRSLIDGFLTLSIYVVGKPNRLTRKIISKIFMERDMMLAAIPKGEYKRKIIKRIICENMLNPNLIGKVYYSRFKE